MKSLEVQVDKDFLSYQSYPIQYPPLKELECVRASDIELIFGEYRDFELLLRNGCVVFFPETKRIALQQFVRTNGIPVVRGSDVWDLLTEPFLDTEFTEEQSQRTIAMLGDLGFSPEQVASIRREVRFLYATNFFGMEWVALGLADVLWGKRCPEEYARWAFAIAEKGYRRAKPYDFCAAKKDKTREDWLQHRVWDVLNREDCKNKRSFYTPPSWWRSKLEGGFARGKFDHDAFFVHFKEQRQASREVHAWLWQQYSLPHRHYHNGAHLEQVLSLLYSFYPHVTGAALLAGLFHDAVYVPGAGDNEERSASEMELHMRDVDVQSHVLRRAKELIFYTKNHSTTSVPDEQMIHDADMGIFGMDRDAYTQYAANIGREYAAIPEDAFRKGRAEFLEGLLQHAERRGRFFYKLDPILEKNVERNINWELETLRRER